MVKKEKGITLITLVIYIIVLIFVVSILAIVSNFFYSNKDYLLDNSRNIAEYNKFNMFFIDDLKNNENAQIITEDNKMQIIFNDGTIYSYIEGDSGIYRNRVKVCNNIAFCQFEKKTETTENTNTQKIIIKVHMVIDSSELFETENSYVLKYW